MVLQNPPLISLTRRHCRFGMTDLAFKERQPDGHEDPRCEDVGRVVDREVDTRKSDECDQRDG